MSATAASWVVICDGCRRALSNDGSPVEPDLGWIGGYPQYAPTLSKKLRYVPKPENPHRHCNECGNDYGDEPEPVYCNECTKKGAL